MTAGRFLGNRSGRSQWLHVTVLKFAGNLCGESVDSSSAEPCKSWSCLQRLLVGLLAGCHPCGPPETHVVQHDHPGELPVPLTTLTKSHTCGTYTCQG